MPLQLRVNKKHAIKVHEQTMRVAERADLLKEVTEHYDYTDPVGHGKYSDQSRSLSFII